MTFSDKVIYQIYPKSFYSCTGGKTGDLRGVIEKVPYIASLGVDMVWFNPFFASPQRDNGYDISDYYAINPDLGTMEDAEEMIAALTERGIGVMFDMVFNHVSTEHEWFARALAGEREYWDYFYIRPGTGGDYPTDWESKFGGPAWSRFGNYTDAEGNPLYYLHLYDVTQADLNWHHEPVRAALYDVVNFWYSKGVRGFRFDVINVIGKAEQLVNPPAGVPSKMLYTDTPIVHTYLKQLNKATFGRYADTVTVGEMSATSIENCVGYSAPQNQELDMVFSFHHLKVDYDNGQKWTKAPFDFPALKRILNDWVLGMQAGGGWNALFWNNHDQPRALNRFGDAHRARAESATMLATVIHLLRGTPFIYQGEEIGMVDPQYYNIEDYVDVEAHNAYSALVDEGASPEYAFEVVRAKARDNSRTPMQWTSSEDVGFGTAAPWLAPSVRHDEATGAGISVADEQRNGRILPYYKELIRLRKRHRIIAEGTYTPYGMEHGSIFAYTREYGGQRLLVLNNFYGESADIAVPGEYAGARVLISNYRDAEQQLRHARQWHNPSEGAPAAANTPTEHTRRDTAAPQGSGLTLTLEPYQALALLVGEGAP